MRHRDQGPNSPNEHSDMRAWECGHLTMRAALLFSVTLIASYWVDAYCYYGEYARTADAAARHVATAIVTVIRNSI
jgi:hypothetical protein